MNEHTEDSAHSEPPPPVPSDEITAVEDAADVPPGTLITRGEAAQVLDTSKSSIRRMEKKGELRAAEIGPNGTRLFELEQVRQVERRVVRARRAIPAPDAYDGEMAREAFTLFDEHVGPVDVVKRTAFDPRAVQALYDRWLSLRGGFFVPAEVAGKISSLPWYRGSSLAFRGSAESLLKGLEAMRPTEICSACEARSPVLCEECSKEASVKEASRRATDARVRREVKEQGDDLERFMKMLEGNVRHASRNGR